jgi:hypothetical protein
MTLWEGATSIYPRTTFFLIKLVVADTELVLHKTRSDPVQLAFVSQSNMIEQVCKQSSGQNIPAAPFQARLAASYEPLVQPMHAAFRLEALGPSFV